MLYANVADLYDFNQNCITPENLEKLSLNNNLKALVLLAYDLYNNFDQALSVYNTFSPLDQQSRKLALHAIQFRFDIQ
jgi:hypothetical protein